MKPVYDEAILYKSLKEVGIVSEASLETALKASKKNHTLLEEELIKLEIISEENLGLLISELVGVPYVNLSRTYLQPSIAALVPQTYAHHNLVLPFEISGNTVKVALYNPKDAQIVSFLEKKLGKKVALFYSTKGYLTDALDIYKKDVFEKNSAVSTQIYSVEEIVRSAYEAKASDIHLEPHSTYAVIRFRVDSILYDRGSLPLAQHEELINKIKILSRLKTDEHFRPQDGRLSLKLEAEELDVRVSIVPFLNGEKAVLRLLSDRSRQHTLENIGLLKEDMDMISEQIKKPYGMILSTGPTGSGKTTTIYSVLKILNERVKNISTIEDPVEYEIEGVNQIQVNTKTELTFSKGLRAILRQDPNVIFVGEIRDEETASIAVNASLTGHLVISSLHTRDAATAFLRLQDMQIQPYLVSSTVNMVIAQRLVRKICDNCKVSYEITPADVQKNIDPSSIKDLFGKERSLTVYKGKGCPVCQGSGYHGRIGIFEILEVKDDLRELVKNQADAITIKNKAIELGMKTMFEDGLQKIKLGYTTLEEVLRVTLE